MKTFANLSLSVLAVLCLAGCASKSITAQLKRYGFTELRPPSQLAAPGTIIQITNRKPLQGTTVCPAAAALGPRVSDSAFTTNSPSASSEMQRAFNGTFKLDGGYLEQLKLNTKFEAVKNLNLQLSNVKLFELSDTAVFKLVKERDPDCARAIAFRRNQKQDLTMINYALVADAQYTISWSRTLDTQVKADISKEIAAALGVNATWSGEDAFKGDNLIWGVRDDARLLQISTALTTTGARDPISILPGSQPLFLEPGK